MVGSLFIIAAPSGAGKTSLVNALVKSLTDIVISISHTTRMIRPGEQAGVNYFFVNPKAFDEMIQADKFLEYASVFGKHYGTSRDFVEQMLRQGRDVILEIDWQGARLIRKRVANTVSIFILPPSREVLRQRLVARAQDNAQTIARRLADATTEISHFKEFDYLLVNDDFNRTLDDLIALVRCQRLQLDKQVQKQAKLLSNLL